MQFIKTSRCVLRPLRYGDRYDICKNITNNVVKWLPSLPSPYSLESADQYISNSIIHFDNKTGVDFGIEYNTKVIGTISLNDIDMHRKARLAYLLNEDYWGRGIMTECTGAVIDYAFGGLHLNKLFTGVVSQNIASLKILEKFNFQIDGVNRGHYYLEGTFFDEILLSLLKSEHEKLIEL